MVSEFLVFVGEAQDLRFLSASKAARFETSPSNDMYWEEVEQYLQSPCVLEGASACLESYLRRCRTVGPGERPL